jgi:hypothetical protein
MEECSPGDSSGANGRQDTWMIWNGPKRDYNHLLLYNFDKTSEKADADWASAQKGNNLYRGY